MRRGYSLVVEAAMSMTDDDWDALAIIRRKPHALPASLYSLAHRGMLYQHDGLTFLTEFGKDVWNFEE